MFEFWLTDMTLSSACTLFAETLFVVSASPSSPTSSMISANAMFRRAQNALIEPILCGWSDDVSGIERYHVEVYYMNVGGTGQLEETGTPLHTEDIRPPHNSFRFTCPTSGVYSIQLTVYDRASHSARARQLFNYDADSTMTSTYSTVSIIILAPFWRILLQ